MRLFRAYQKELRQLHFSIFLSICLAGYTLLIFAIDQVQSFLNPSIETSIMWTAINAMVGWLAILLVVSYWRYSKVSLDSKELEAMIEGMNPDVVLVVNPSREILMCNDSVEGLFGYHPEEVLSKSTDFLYRDRRSAPGQTMGIYEQLEKLGFHYGYATGIKKTGEDVPLEIITGNLRGRPGAVLQVRDATKLTHIQQSDKAKSQLVEELEESLKKLRQVELSRDNLTQMIVHDMKTPLQIVLGNLEMTEADIKQGKETNKQGVQHALNQTRRLVGMVNSILEVSRLESGAIELNTSPLDLRTVLEKSAEEIQGISPDLHISLDLPETVIQVSGDSGILHRVVTNLLSNAVHHGQGKAIRAGIERKDGFVRLSVADSGPGISPEHRDKIFDKFARFKADESSPKSTGLGLTFCKLAVEAHEGQIGVESTAGTGCTFWFHLPELEVQES